MKHWLWRRSLGRAGRITAAEAASRLRAARHLLFLAPHQSRHNLLITTPVLRNLRIVLPDARISLVAGPGNVDAVRDNPDLDALEVARLDGPLGGIHLSRLAARLRAGKPDLAVLPDGATLGAVALARQSGARLLVALDDGIPETLRPAFHCLVPLPEEPKTHVVDRALMLLEELGIPVEDRGLVLGVTDDQRAEAEELLRGVDLDPGQPVLGAWVGGSPRRPEQQWPATHYASVLQHAARDLGWQTLILGRSEDIPTIEQVISLGKTPIPHLLDLSFTETKGVLSRFRFFVTHDGEPAHLAAAVGTPSFVVCLSVPPWQWAPYGSHITVSEEFGQVPASSEVWRRILDRVEA